jgi:hypothetical protein
LRAAIAQKDDGTGLIADLSKWLDEQKKSPALLAGAQVKLATLLLQLDEIRDAGPADEVKRLIKALTEALAQPLTEAEKTAILEALPPLGKRLDDFVVGRAPRIHIIKATYGDHRTGRTCKADAYFLGKCEAKTKCPGDNDVIGPVEVCGFDPAPLAAESEKKAIVTYKCVNFGLRTWDEILRNENKNGKAVDLRGKGWIICEPR